jgi:hypothetical protein
MYAHLLFVVVGIFGPVLARLKPSTAVSPPVLPPVLPTGLVELRLGIAGTCGYTLAA